MTETEIFPGPSLSTSQRRDRRQGQVTIVTGTQAGTYTVNCNGTGQFIRVITTNGVSTNQVDDFVITSAVVQDGVLLATTIVDAQETPSTSVAGGIFLIRTHSRLPDFFY
jgi:hypothetical protein